VLRNSKWTFSRIAPLSAVGALLLGSVGLAACSTSSSPGTSAGSGSGSGQTISQFTVGFDPAVSTLNYAKSNIGYQLGGLALEPLLIAEKSGKLQPWLAQSWKQTSPTTYVYNIRPGVKFSDGDPLTATDVAFSLNYYRRPGSLDAYNFPTTLKSITATSPDTVTVTLSAPDAAWAVVPAGDPMGIFEKKFFEAHQTTFGAPGTGVMGTGPWEFTSFNGTTSAELKANPHYWGGPVKIKQVSVQFFSSETSEALAFRDGEINLAFPIDNKAFASTAGTKLTTVPSYAVQGEFLMNTIQKPWNDVHVRLAVAYALNRTDLINAWGGYADPVYQFLTAGLLENIATPSQVSDALKSVPVYSYDLAKAKAEMAQSAYPHGVNATVSVEGAGSYPNVSQAIAAELAPIGIHLKLDVMTVDQQNANLTSGNRQGILATFTYSGSVSRDPGEAFDFQMGKTNISAGNWNTMNWAPTPVDNLINQGFTTTDNAARLRIYGQIDTAYAQAAPFIPIFNEEATVALANGYTWPDFNGYYYDLGPWLLGINKTS
jgi:peptide/nickel transport system substrate-binding protein